MQRGGDRHDGLPASPRFGPLAHAGQHCSLDIDDDGFVKPQTDGLLWLPGPGSTRQCTHPECGVKGVNGPPQWAI